MVTATVAPAVPVRTRRQAGAHAVLAVSAFGAFMAFLDATVVNVAFPSIRASFPSAGINELSWVLNAYNIVFAGLLVVFGRLADLLGRRRMFAVGIILFTATSGACAASTSIEMLIAFRVLQGVGAALLVPASLAMVVHAAAPERRAHTISLWGAAAALAAGLGPPLGGALVDAWNWRLTFLINLPLGVVGWALARRTIVESRAPGRRVMPDIGGALALSVGLAAVTLGLVQAPTWGWGGAGTVAAFAAGAACTAGFVASSRRHPSPVLDPRLLRIRGFAVGNVVVVAAGLGLYTYLLTHILWLHYIWGYSLLKAGLAVAPGALVAVVVAAPCGELADRYGARAVAVPGALIWAAAYLWYVTRVGVHPDFLGQWLPGQIISGVGVGATLPIATSGSLASVPAARYATASAVSSSSRQLGGVLGVSLLTVFIAHAATPVTLATALRHGWQLAGGSFVVAAAAALFFGRVKAGTAAEADTGTNAPTLSLADPDLELPAPPEASDLLSMLPEEIRTTVLATGKEVRLPAGEVLFTAGDPADAMYLVLAGQLEVQLPGGARGDIPSGAAVGELALLTGTPRSGTVVARRDSDLLSVSREGYDALAHTHPEVVGAVATVLARQLQARAPVDAIRHQPKVVAVVSVDASVTPQALAEVYTAVHDGLAGRLRVECLRDPSPEQLGAAERTSDRVLLVAADTGAWHDSCIRQSDRLVLVAANPEPRAVAGLAPGADVVLCGEAPTTAELLRWYDETACRRVHHLGADPHEWRARLQPLTNRIAGRSVGLALAGGGARSLAHLGVLEVFEEAGVRVDRIAGSSMAAFVAAGYATGITAAELDAVVFDEFVRRRPFSDYRLPVHSLASGRRGHAMLRRTFGDLNFEELPRELAVASTDLYARAPVYHRRGLVREAVAASICLPVLFPPQQLDGKVLVDGSLTDNCPTAPLTEADEGPVVAVRIGLGAPGPRSATRLPSLGETLLRVMQMGTRTPGGAGSDGITLAVSPDTRGIGLLEFHQIDAAREAGRQAGRAALEALEGRLT